MIGVLYSYLFVGGVLGISTYLSHLQYVTDEMARKAIHVLVVHWYLLALFWFDNAFVAAFVPFTFIILNYMSFKFKLVKAMERHPENSGDIGTVYYALSLTIITFFAFYFNLQMFGLFALFVMGYADGLAALIGKHWPSTILYGQKTLSGSISFLLITLFVGFLTVYDIIGLHILWLAVLATGIELFSKKGLDNLTVPLTLFLLLVVFV